MDNKKVIKNYQSTTYYMGARFDLDIDIYNDCIKWHLEATNQFSDDKIEYFEQTISDFILNGIPNIAKEVIDLEVLKELNDFIKCYNKNKKSGNDI